MYLGSWHIDDYLPIPVVTHRWSSGAAYAATSLTYSIYEDASTSGLFENVDMTPASPFDTITGFYLSRVQLTAANGFEVGKNYTVVIKATVDSVAAVEAHTFQLQEDLATQVAAILTDTGTTLPATLASILEDTGTTLPATLATIAGYIDTEIAAILVDTGTTIPGLIAALNDISTADVNTQAAAALVAIHLDHLLAADYDPASKPGTATALLNEIVENDAGVSRFTVNALENAPSGTGASAATIADAVWDEAGADHVAAGSMGAQVETKIDQILADTDELQSDDIPTTLASILTDTGTTLPATLASILEDTGTTLPATLAAILEDTGTTLPASLAAIVGYIDTEVAAILEDTGTTIPATLASILTDTGTTLPATLADILTDTGTTLPATLATIAGYIDTEVAGILEDTGTTLPATLAAIQAVTDALTAANATKLGAAASTITVGTVSHDATAATTTVFFSRDVTIAASDHFKDQLIRFTDGALEDQETDITGYELIDGEGRFTVTALTSAPADNVKFVIL